MESDGEVVRQSRRTDTYDSLFDRLRREERIYPCRCSRQEIATAASAPHGAEPVYPGTCSDAAVPAEQARAWRFRVPAGIVTFEDGVFGTISQDVARDVGDFVIRREQPERAYAYQLAVVADDAAQEITQVVRGADLLDSTARQILLGRAFGFPIPSFAHMPLLVSQSGDKLSKRSGSRQLAEAAGRGQLPAIVAALLTTLGQKPRLDDALDSFDAAKIPKEREIRLAPPAE
jgi:glutamyl/glutaminyl-tRNA synthetase